MTPVVSVITTLYNYSRFVGDAIKSFQAQKIPAEMIIVDDASTDKPERVIGSFRDKRIKYIRLKHNGGYSHAKNVGIKAAQSEVLVMLDADDMLSKASLATRLAKLQEGYDFVHGPVLDMINGVTGGSKLWKKWLKSHIYKNVHAQGVMLRKDIHRKIGLYDEKLRCKSDREMWARVFNHGFKIGWVEQYVGLYRIHSRQMSRSAAKAKINDELQREVLETIERRKVDLSDVEML